MSFLTTLISLFPLLSYWLHHITFSSSHFHSHLISSHHTSHHHSHCLLSHSIHLFILTTFHAFSHHLICITLITSYIHLSFIPHHPHSILLPFHHSRIFHFSTHPFHHGALRDFLKTHFHSFHLSYPSIHYSILVSFLFQLHHRHHHSSLLFIVIRFHALYPFIYIYSHSILPLNQFNHTLFHFHSNTLIPFYFIIPLHMLFLFWLLILTHSVVSSHFIIRRSHSFHPFLFSFLSLPSFTFHSSRFFATHLPVSTLNSILVCSDSCYHIFICCIDRKHSLSIRRNRFCLWWQIRERQHRMMRKWESEYLWVGGNRCSRSMHNRSRFHQMII